jgi:hypothetical protein
MPVPPVPQVASTAPALPRTEEARGSNPLTSTHKPAGLGDAQTVRPGTQEGNAITDASVSLASNLTHDHEAPLHRGWHRAGGKPPRTRVTRR